MKNIDKTNYDGYSKYDQIVSQTYEESRRFEKHWHEENKFIESYLKKIRSINY